MAHGWLQSFDDHLEVFSAGTEPAGKVNDKAVMVMKEAGIDISHHYPKHVNQYLKDSWHYVITVCDSVNEKCPYFPGEVKQRLHIGFEDPSHATGTDEFILDEFRKVRDQIKEEFWRFYLERIKK
jgi:arsenate reductase (thioredoxin)